MTTPVTQFKVHIRNARHRWYRILLIRLLTLTLLGLLGLIMSQTTMTATDFHHSTLGHFYHSLISF